MNVVESNNTRNLFRCEVVISGKSKKDRQAAIEKEDTQEITQMEINQTKAGRTFVPSLGSEATPPQTPPIPPPPRAIPEFRGQIVRIIFHKQLVPQCRLPQALVIAFVLERDHLTLAENLTCRYHGVVADRELEI